MSISDTNVSILIGRLTRDPELRYTNNGQSVCSFTLANNRSYTSNGDKKEYTSFINCVAWARLGEAISEYAQKGQRMCVTGRLHQRSWEDKDGKSRSAIEVAVDSFQLLEKKDE